MDAPQLFFSLTESNNKQWFNISIHCEILSDSKISDEYCPWPGFLRASLACYGLIAWRKYHAIFRKTVRSWRQNLTQPKVFSSLLFTVAHVTVYCVVGSFIYHHVTRCSFVQNSPMHHLLHIIFWNSVKAMKWNAPLGCLTHTKPLTCIAVKAGWRFHWPSFCRQEN